MTLKEAFYQAISKRGVYNKLNLDKSTVSHMRSKMKYGDFPSEGTMKRHIKKLGYVIESPETWTLKSNKDHN
jgi:hypothetical protein